MAIKLKKKTILEIEKNNVIESIWSKGLEEILWKIIKNPFQYRIGRCNLWQKLC